MICSVSAVIALPIKLNTHTFESSHHAEQRPHLHRHDGVLVATLNRAGVQSVCVLRKEAVP